MKLIIIVKIIKGTIFDNNSTQNDNKLQNLMNTEGTVIDVNRLFDVHEKEEQIAEEEIKKEENKKDNRDIKNSSRFNSCT